MEKSTYMYVCMYVLRENLKHKHNESKTKRKEMEMEMGIYFQSGKGINFYKLSLLNNCVIAAKPVSLYFCNSRLLESLQ